MTDARKLAKLLLDAGYDDGFGVTSLDTLLCEQMTRDKRLDFARFLEGVARAALEAEAASAYARGLEDAAGVAERLARAAEGKSGAVWESAIGAWREGAAAIRELKEKP